MVGLDVLGADTATAPASSKSVVRQWMQTTAKPFMISWPEKDQRQLEADAELFFATHPNPTQEEAQGFLEDHGIGGNFLTRKYGGVRGWEWGAIGVGGFTFVAVVLKFLFGRKVPA